MSEHEEETTEAMVAEANEPDEETPEPDEEPDEEEEAAPEPEAAPDEVDAKAASVKLDKYREKALKYLARNMDEQLGEDAVDYMECPFCTFTNTPGFIHISPCPPALLGTVYEWTNTTAPDEYLADTASRQCDSCQGLGEVASGSKVRGQETLVCVTCTGKGWIAVGAERQGGNMIVSNGPAASIQPPADSAAEMIDPGEYDNLTVAEAKARGALFIAPVSYG